MPVTKDIDFFPLVLWHRPDLINLTAAMMLSKLRGIFGEALIVTDDGRDPGTVPPGGSVTSWHFKGQAFDLRIREWTWEKLWRFVAAVTILQESLPPGMNGIELELVWSAKDKHAHIAFTLDARPCRLIVAAD